MKPLFSVVIPTYNRAGYIERSIESVLNQSFEELELIVINDGSSDRTGEIVRKYAKEDSRVRYMKTVNMGASVARNIGLAMARADWIAFLDSDDLWDSNRLEIVAAEIGKADQMQFYITDYRSIDREKSLINKEFIDSPYLDQIILSFGSVGATKNLIVPRQFIEQIGGFDPRLTSAQDTDVFYRLIRRYPMRHLPGVFSIHDLGSDNRITKIPDQKLGGLEYFFIKHQEDMTVLSRNICRKKIFVFSWRFRLWGKIIKYFPSALLIKCLNWLYAVKDDRELFLKKGFLLNILKRKSF